jgi:hypothetical protein
MRGIKEGHHGVQTWSKELARPGDWWRLYTSMRDCLRNRDICRTMESMYVNLPRGPWRATFRNRWCGYRRKTNHRLPISRFCIRAYLLIFQVDFHKYAQHSDPPSRIALMQPSRLSCLRKSNSRNRLRTLYNADAERSSVPRELSESPASWNLRKTSSSIAIGLHINATHPSESLSFSRFITCLSR